MWMRKVRRDAISKKPPATRKGIPNSPASATQPKQEVVPHIHSARKRPCEVTLTQREQNTSKRNPVSGKWVVLPPAIEMLRPGYSHRNCFIHNSLLLEEGTMFGV